MFLGGLMEADVVGNAINPDRAADFRDAWETLVYSLESTDGGESYPMVIYSRKRDGFDRPTAILTRVNMVRTRTLFVRTQRRRLP